MIRALLVAKVVLNEAVIVKVKVLLVDSNAIFDDGSEEAVRTLQSDLLNAGLGQRALDGAIA